MNAHAMPTVNPATHLNPPPPLIAFTPADEEFAAGAIAFEEKFGDRLFWHPDPFSYGYEDKQLGVTRIHTITACEYQAKVQALRHLLWRREHSA
jgi:hypothetical protein